MNHSHPRQLSPPEWEHRETKYEEYLLRIGPVTMKFHDADCTSIDWMRVDDIREASLLVKAPCPGIAPREIAVVLDVPNVGAAEIYSKRPNHLTAYVNKTTERKPKP